MIDFLMISTRSTKRGVIEIYPKFIIKKSSDLMIRGGDFYAIWIEERGLWSTDTLAPAKRRTASAIFCIPSWLISCRDIVCMGTAEVTLLGDLRAVTVTFSI